MEGLNFAMHILPPVERGLCCMPLAVTIIKILSQIGLPYNQISVLDLSQLFWLIQYFRNIAFESLSVFLCLAPTCKVNLKMFDKVNYFW